MKNCYVIAITRGDDVQFVQIADEMYNRIKALRARILKLILIGNNCIQATVIHTIF